MALGLSGNAQGADCAGRAGESMRNLHGALRYLQKPAYFAGAEQSTVAALAEWLVGSDKIITF